MVAAGQAHLVPAALLEVKWFLRFYKLAVCDVVVAVISSSLLS